MEMAGEWAARIGTASEQGPRALGAALDAFAGDPPPLTPVFVHRFLQQLRLTRGSAAPLAQIEAWIGDRALGAEDAAARSAQHLALAQRDDGAQHHLAAHHRPPGLAGAGGAAERHGGGAAPGPVGLLPAHDLRHARHLPPRGGARRPPHGARRAGGGARGGGAGPRGDERERRGATVARARGLPPGGRGARRPGIRHGIPPAARRGAAPCGAEAPGPGLRRRGHRRHGGGAGGGALACRPRGVDRVGGRPRPSLRAPSRLRHRPERCKPAAHGLPAAARASQAGAARERWDRRGAVHRRRRPHPVPQRGGGDGGAGAPGGAVPVQPTVAPALRPARRLHRRGCGARRG